MLERQPGLNPFRVIGGYRDMYIATTSPGQITVDTSGYGALIVEADGFADNLQVHWGNAKGLHWYPGYHLPADANSNFDFATEGVTHLALTVNWASGTNRRPEEWNSGRASLTIRSGVGADGRASGGQYFTIPIVDSAIRQTYLMPLDRSLVDLRDVDNISLYAPLGGFGPFGLSIDSVLAVQVVPEPASLGLLSVGGLSLLRRRRH